MKTEDTTQMATAHMANERAPLEITEWGTAGAELQARQAKAEIASGEGTKFASAREILQALKLRRALRHIVAETHEAEA